MRFTCAARTDVGIVRSGNEDNYLMLSDRGIFIVADGMGGHAAGEVASEMAVRITSHEIGTVRGLSDAEVPAFASVIRSVRSDQEAGVLIIDHNMALIMEVCDRIYVLDQGRLLAEGAPAEIRRNIDVAAAYLGGSAAPAASNGQAGEDDA